MEAVSLQSEEPAWWIEDIDDVPLGERLEKIGNPTAAFCCLLMRPLSFSPFQSCVYFGKEK